MRRTLVPSISTSVASNGGSITAPTVNCSSGPSWVEQRAWMWPLRRSFGRGSDRSSRLEVGAVHEVAGIRQAGRGDPGRFGQEREVRRDDDEVGLLPSRRAGRRTAAAPAPG